MASIRLSCEQRSSTIMTVNTSKNYLILQGVQDGSGWSITVDKKSGQVPVSSSLDGEKGISHLVCVLVAKKLFCCS